MQSTHATEVPSGRSPNRPPLLGIVGCGTLGRELIRRLDERETRSHSSAARLDSVTSRDAAKARAYLATLPHPPPYLPLEELIARCDLIVETAGGHVVADLARRTFAAGKDLLVISTGALLDHPEVLDEARRTGCRLILPSGGVAAIDGLKSAARGRLDRVTFVMRKPPQGWAGAPYLKAQGISVEGLTEEKELFHGPVREACRGFPENVNISATVALAGLGPDRTLLRILAVPGMKRNTHTLEIEGEFGLITMNIGNIPTENPKTGRLVALSILRALDDAFDPVRIGS